MPKPTTKDELMRIEAYLYKLQDRIDQTLADLGKTLNTLSQHARSVTASLANTGSGITALEERAASHGQAIEELNRRTFKLNVEIEGLKLEAERRALITAALETRAERLEQAARELPDLPRRIASVESAVWDCRKRTGAIETRVEKLEKADKWRGSDE